MHRLHRSARWHLTSQGLVMTSAIFESETAGGVLLLTVGQILLVIIACMFGVASTRATQDAKRKAHTQAWHFEQLIPRGRTTGSDRPWATPPSHPKGIPSS